MAGEEALQPPSSSSATSPPESSSHSTGSTAFEEAAEASESAAASTDSTAEPARTPEEQPAVAEERLSLSHEDAAPPTPPPIIRNLDEDPHPSPSIPAPLVKDEANLSMASGENGRLSAELDDKSRPRNTSSPDPGTMLLQTLRTQISELGSQVTQLNSKLVKSYERVAGLEDELHVTKEELEKVKERNKALDLDAAQHAEALRGGILVESADVQGELQRLTQRLLNETAARSASESSLSSLQSELDDLSASLFSEANKMVATEKLTRIKAERKQMDAEEAMKGVQEAMNGMREVLGGLRGQLEEAEKERDGYRQKWLEMGGVEDLPPPPVDEAGAGIVFSDGNIVTAGAGVTNDSTTSLASVRAVSGYTPRQTLAPAPSHQPPKLMNDILPYGEFINFIRHLKKTRSEALARPVQPHDVYYPSVVGNDTGRIRPSDGGYYPSSSTLPPPDPKELLASVLPLSAHLSQPFLKRCVEEDSDPALRLDLAPGLNFLSRRTVLTAIVEGSLVIEPVWGNASQYDTCTLCGTSLERWGGSGNGSGAWNGAGPMSGGGGGTRTPTGGTAQTMRKMLGTSGWSFGNLKSKKSASMLSHPSSDAPSTPSALNSTGMGNRSFSYPASLPASPSDRDRADLHTFRANDNASTRYALCPAYCLTRLRAVCDFWTYVRSVEKGLLLEEGFRFAGKTAQGQQGHRKTPSANANLAGIGAGAAGSANSLGLERREAPPSPVTVIEPAEDEQGSGSEKKGNESGEKDATADGEDKETSGEEEKRSGEGEGAEKDRLEPVAAELITSSPDPDSSNFPSDSEEKPLSGTPAETKRSPSTNAPPPLPKRSAARSPALPPRPTSPKPREQPMPGIHAAPPVASSMSLPPPPRRAATGVTRPEPPPRQSSHNVHAANGTVGPSGAQDALGLGPGWEDRCWGEVIRLKEEMFWRRIGAVQGKET